MNFKKKKNKQGGNQTTTVNHVRSFDNVEKPNKIGHKPKFP
jgi:hypothetical protein